MTAQLHIVKMVLLETDSHR